MASFPIYNASWPASLASRTVRENSPENWEPPNPRKSACARNGLFRAEKYEFSLLIPGITSSFCVLCVLRVSIFMQICVMSFRPQKEQLKMSHSEKEFKWHFDGTGPKRKLSAHVAGLIERDENFYGFNWNVWEVSANWFNEDITFRIIKYWFHFNTMHCYTKAQTGP